MDVVTMQQSLAVADKRYGRLIPPSGDTTGAADLAAFNAALTARSYAKGVPGQTYYFNGPVYLGSHNVLDMTGCTIIMPTGTATNILRNRAVDATRSTADGQSLAGSASITSLTAAFVSGDAGSAIGVVGAATGGATWYGVIANPVSASTATGWAATTAAGLGAFIRPVTANGRLYWATTAGTTGGAEPTWPTTTGSTVTDGSVVWTCLGAATGATMQATRYNTTAANMTADLAVTGAALSIFGTRDTDITVMGGTWTFCDQTSVANPTPLNQQPTCFRRVDGIRLRDMRITQLGVQGVGGRICISVADATDAHARDIFFVQAAANMQFDAPIFGASIENIYGCAGDDMVALSTQDQTAAGAGGGNYLRDTQGNIGGVEVRNITGMNAGATTCWNTFKLYGLGGGSAKFSMTNINIEDIKGTVSSSGNGVNVVGDSSLFIDDLQIRNINVASGGSHPIVQVQGINHYNNVLVDNVVWTSSAPCSQGIVQITDPRGSIRVANLKLNSAPAGTNIGLKVIASSNGALSGASWGSAITLDGVYCGNNNTTGAAIFVAFQFATSATGGTLPFLRIANAYVAPSTSGYLVQLVNALALPDLDISDVKASGLTALISAPSSTSAIVARLSNVSAAGVNLAAVSCPLTIKMVNTLANTSGAVIALTGANATPVRIKTGNFAQAGAGVGVTRDGSQSVSVNGADFAVDGAILTPTDQDLINNTNAGFAFGTGVGIWSAALSAWRALGQALQTITTTDPTISSDSSTGVVVGSQWINTTAKTLYVCLANAVGAAVWQRLTADVQPFVASGTWAKPAWAQTIIAQCIGSGAGGGSGAQQVSGTACSGGAGGGGAGYSIRTFAAATLGATETVTVASTTPAGGVAQASTTTAGNAGTSGGTSSFGTHLRAGGGGAGAGGALNAASTAGAGGSGSTSNGGGGGGGPNGGGGATGGVASGAPGGGGGGGIASTPANLAGGPGNIGASGLAAGTFGATNGGAGGSGGVAQTNEATTGGSGGGGGSSITIAGGVGGAGGKYGAGGGGGGASLNGQSSGAGGTGAAGIVVVISE